MKKTVFAGLGICAFALAYAAKDSVIMTVNGVDVPKSEFEYLYNKNSQQQINPQSLQEYVEMFKLYKMKVADARAEGIDTIATFVKEAEQYRHDLAAPYLADSVFLNKLVEEAYNRSKEEVEAYHIMLFKTRDAVRNHELRLLADSLKTCLDNGEDFATLASNYSQDRGSQARGGRMGYIVANTYPIDFEIAAYSLTEGQISDVVESGVGYHILKGGKHRPARGKVQVAHILKLTQGKDSVGKAVARQQIDSLYNLAVENPVAFNQLASKNSEDRSSARQGGMLPMFGAGEMVEEFDSAAFALKDGEISRPVETAYGYHIIMRYRSEQPASLEKMKPNLLSRISSPSDSRSRLVMENQNKKLAKKHKGSINKKTLEALNADVLKNGIDSTLFEKWSVAPIADMTLFTVKGDKSTVKDLVESLPKRNMPASEEAVNTLNEGVSKFYNSKLVAAEEAILEQKEPDYRNLLKEYVDGSLLYEVSVRKVWDRAAKDTEGLKKYFEENRDNYKWTEPHAKGVLVQTVNDSVSQLIRARAVELPADTLLTTLRKEFAGKASFDKVLVSQGTNAMVDYLVFGGSEVKPSNSKFTEMFMINPRVITEPEEVGDVKGMVTSDYQNEFQAAWEKELRQKYPVVVNEKVLKSVKTKK